MSDDQAENQKPTAENTEREESSQISVRKHFSNLAGTILLVIFFMAILIWIRFSPAAPPEISSDSQTETKSDEQQKEDSRDSQINDALDNFLTTNYLGWQQQGKSFDDNSSDEDRLQIFDVHLVSGGKNQIIKVYVEKFQKDDDSGEYWFAYQPENQQISDSEKQNAKKSPVDNSSEKDDSNARK